MSLTSEQCTARAEAFEECASHLEQDWTDNPVELEQGIILTKQLRDKADKYHTMAADRN